MVCGNVDFGLSGGEEAGNATKEQFMDNLNYSDKLKFYGFKRGNGDLLLSFIYIYIYTHQFSLLQGKKTKKCNIASVHPVLSKGKKKAQTCIYFF